MTYWKCSTGLPPSGPREVKALVCQWTSKGCVAKPLSLICYWNTHTSVLCPWISPDKRHPAVSNSNVKKEKTNKKDLLDVVTSALHAVVLQSAVLQVTCLRFGIILTFQSSYHIAWVLVSLSKLSVVFLSRQSAGFSQMERAVWNLLFVSENWWDLAHVFRG